MDINGTPTAPITITCSCCGRSIAARDAFRRGRNVVCGNCDANEQPGCPNCTGEPYFGGSLSDE